MSRTINPLTYGIPNPPFTEAAMSSHPLPPDPPVEWRPVLQPGFLTGAGRRGRAAP